ncbi:MAG: alpha/beta hydrolase-fold protein [Acidimicrobiia bacterium]
MPAPHLRDPVRGSVLLSAWFFALLVAVPCAVLVGTALVEWRRRRARRAGRSVRSGWQMAVVRALAVVLTLVSASAAALDGVNRHFEYIPSFAALFGQVSRDMVPASVARLESRVGGAGPGNSVATPLPMPRHGAVEQVSIAGSVSGVAARTGFVYLPKQYFDPARRGRRFPVLYLLHGSPGVAADWLRGAFVDQAMDSLIDAGAVAPFIIVMPDVNGGYARDTECQDIVSGPQVQTYLVRDVVDWVDAHYRTVTDRGARAIGGLSTGGYCALNLVLRHQDRFSAIVSHSGTLDPIESAYSGRLWGGSRKLRAENSPSVYLPTIPIPAPIGVYLDAGAGDRDAIRAGRRAQALFRQRAVPVTFNVVRGEGHTFAAWRENLALSLPWVSNWFKVHDPVADQ